MFARRQLLTLSIVALAVLAVAIWIGTRSQKTEAPKTTGTKVLPMLAGKLNDVSELRIVKGGDKAAVTLKRVGGAEQKDSWQVADRGGYPADFTKVRELLIKLSELEVVEEKTSNPQSYAALGVEDLKDEKAAGKRVDLAGLTPPVALIVGKSASYSGNYVRVSGAERSVLAKPQLSIADEPNTWLNHTLLDFPEARIQEVRLSNIAPSEPGQAKKPAPRTSYIVTREHRDQNDFTVPNLPSGKKLSSPGAASAIPGGLASLTLDDVRPLAADEDWSKNPEVSTAEYRFFDGTIVTVKGYTVDNDKHWVRFTVGFDAAQNTRFKPKTPAKAAADSKADGAAKTGSSLPAIVPGKDTITGDAANAASAAGKSPEELRGEAQKLDEQLRKWAYQIPSYKYENLFKPLDQLLAK